MIEPQDSPDKTPDSGELPDAHAAPDGVWVSLPPVDIAGASFSFVCAADYRFPSAAGNPPPSYQEIQRRQIAERFVSIPNPADWSVVRSGDLLVLDRYQMLVLDPAERGHFHYVRLGPGDDSGFAKLDTSTFSIAKIKEVVGIRRATFPHALGGEIAIHSLDRRETLLHNVQALLEVSERAGLDFSCSLYSSVASDAPFQTLRRLVNLEDGRILTVDLSLDDPQKFRAIYLNLRVSPDPAECFIESWNDGSPDAANDFGEPDPLATYSIDSTQFGFRRPRAADEDSIENEESEEFGASAWQDRDDDAEMELAPSLLANSSLNESDDPGLPAGLSAGIDSALVIANRFLQIRKYLTSRS